MTNTNDILKEMEDNEALQWLFEHKDLIRERAIEELINYEKSI